jgi:hypothetical protein
MLNLLCRMKGEMQASQVLYRDSICKLCIRGLFNCSFGSSD